MKSRHVSVTLLSSLLLNVILQGNHAESTQQLSAGETIQLSVSSGSPKYYRVEASGSRRLEVTLTKSRGQVCPFSPDNGNTEPTMYVSTSLGDVTSQNAAMTGYPYKDCSSGDFGQIERLAIPAQGATVYVGVVAGGTGMRLRTAYLENTESFRKKRVVDGRVASQHSIPWQVQLRYNFRDGSTSHLCGGSLLTREWVVTAAHCLPEYIQAKVKSGIEFSVRLGGHYLNENDSQLVSFGIEDIITHEDYDNTKKYSDIALIHLRETASFSSGIQTIQLPTKSDLRIVTAGLTATVSGWGWMSPDGLASKELMQADVPIVAESRCKSYVESGGTTLYGDAVLCTDATGQGPCLGDSGGPLFVYHNSRHLLIGIVSYGSEHCGTDGSASTAVYARTSSLGPWIEERINSPNKPGNWWNGASKLPIEYASGGDFIGRPFRGVLHTTESKAYHPSTKTYYGRTGTAPHFTVAVQGSESKVYQHYPISVASRALRRTGTVQTNRANAIQIEIAWLAEEIQSIPVHMKNRLAELVRWIELRTGIQRRSPLFYGSTKAYGEKALSRMSATDWYDFNGWCGHQHVPDNTHWDPGQIDIQYLLTHGVRDTIYKISIHTGSVVQGGTSASVSIALAGEWDYTQKFTIATPHSGSFDRGKVGVVIVSTDKFLGSLRRIIVGHDNSGLLPGWYIDKVVVTKQEGNHRFE